MGNKHSVGAGFLPELEGMVERGKLAEKLRRLLALGDAQMAAIIEPVLALVSAVERQDVCGPETAEHFRYMSGMSAEQIARMYADEISSRMFSSANLLQRDLARAAAFLPEPFRGYQQMGAILLAAQLGGDRLTEFDLPQVALRWLDRLGKPGFIGTGDFLERNPCMIPVCFSGADAIESAAEYPQAYYGHQPFLSSAGSSSVLLASCKKWPTKDAYAFCPLPVWAADHNGKAFWFEDHTWPEQKAELAKLQRQHRGMTVRFAYLHELAFLDLTWRLATLGSPMEIGAFRSEDPDDENGCLTYGRVKERGAEIEQEKKPSEFTEAVLPLFFIESEKGEKKKKK